MGKSKAVTVGYKYYSGQHHVLCHGPIDRIEQILVDDRNAWTGEATGGSITIAAESLFGGESREGGISGTVDIAMGGPDQLQNSYLVSKLGADVPAYRGVVSAILRQCYMGNNPYFKPWAYRGARIAVRQDGIDQWYQAKAGISHTLNGSASFYFLLDRSNSLSSGQFAAIKNAAKAGLDLIDDYVNANPGERVDVGVRFYSDGSTGSELTDVDSADIAALKSFIDGATQVTGGDVNSAFGFIESWFTASLGVAFDKRAVIFVTDSGTEDGMTATSSPGGNGYEMINRLAPFSYPNTVDIYAINYNTSETAYTGLIDNTGSDGIPIISGSDDAGLTDAVAAALSSRFTDLNPAHIIRECLTDPDWGMGYQDADIDDASFQAAANVLANEGLGISLLWDRQTTLESFVAEVIKHIDAALYVSRATGKFVLKLIRFDYDPETLLVLDESNIAKIQNPSTPTFGELTNSITVKFWDAETSKDASVTLQDPALIQMQGAVIGTTVQYPGFTYSRNAVIAAQRDLRSVSFPLFACTIFANRDAKDLNIGDVFKLSWGKWQIDNLIMRVTALAFGDGKSSQVRITCVQDVFNTPDVQLVLDDGGAWEDPSSDATAATNRIAFEAPYYELSQMLGQADLDSSLGTNPEVGYVMAAAAQPASGFNARLWTDAGPGYEDVNAMDFAPSATLDGDLDQITTVVPIENASNFDLIVIGSFCQIGEGNEDMELCRVDAVDEVGGTVTLGRGALDTVPQIHLSGTRLYFWDAYSGIDPTQYVAGEEVDLKITPISGAGQLPLASAPADTVTLDNRAIRPYPPANLTVNGESYNPGQTYSGVITLAWAHRDRLQQTGGVIYDHLDGSIGPEAGTEYFVRGYQSDVLIDEFTAIAGATYDWTPSVGGVWEVHVGAVRDGYESMQTAYHTFTYGDAYPYTIPIINGDFETGDATGWATISGVGGNVSVGGGNVGTPVGSYLGTVSSNQGAVSWGQTITFADLYHADIDDGLLWLTLSVNQNAFNEDSDAFGPEFEFMDTDGNIRGGRTHAMQDPDILGGASNWRYRTLVPPGSRSMRLRVNGRRFTGTELSVYVDDFVGTMEPFGGVISNLFVSSDGDDHATWTVASGTGVTIGATSAWGTYERYGYYGGDIASASHYKDYAFAGDELTAIAAGRAALQISAWLMNENADDQCRLRVELLGAADAVLTSWETGAATVNYGLIGTIFDIPGFKVPTGALKARCRFYWTRADGTVNDAMISHLNVQLFTLDAVAPSGTPTSTKWRVRNFATAGTPGGASVWRTAISEIEMRETASGANACTGGTASSSSRWQNNAIYAASVALTVDTATEALSAQGQWPYWWQYEFASAVNIAEVAIKARDTGMGDEPALFLLEYFDGTDWIAHDLFASEGVWTANEQRVFTVG